jgi:hypothetical protein
MKGRTSRSNDDNEWEGNVKYRVKATMEAHDGKLKVELEILELLYAVYFVFLVIFVRGYNGKREQKMK